MTAETSRQMRDDCHGRGCVFFNDTATTEIYTLSLHDALPILFAHNDDMGLGALEAITAAGKVPGKDIKIITIDAVKDGMQALADGKFNFIAECSPLLGPQLMELVKKVHKGENVPPRIETEETTFTQEQAKAALPTRQY